MTKEEPYYVRLTYSVWPSIYSGEPHISFPTRHAAIRFAKNNISDVIPRSRVYTFRDELIAEFSQNKLGL